MDALKNPELKQGLIDLFLYERDDNCFFNVLEFYVIEGSLYRLQPSGLIDRYFKKMSDRLFKKYPGNMRAKIKRTLASELREDFSRLETVYSFLGYHEGFETVAYANTLECIMLKNNFFEDEYFMQVHQHLSMNKDIEKFKHNLKKELYEDVFVKELIASYAKEFTDVFVNSKVMHLNRDLDSQIVLNFDETGYYLYNDNLLISMEKLNTLVNRTEALLNRSGLTLFTECFFRGLTDKVLMRYK